RGPLLASATGRGARRKLKRGVLFQDGALNLLQARVRFNAKFLHQHATGRVINGQRLRLPPAPVQRDHQQLIAALPERMGGDQRTELADDVRVTAERDIRRYPVLDSACPQLLQARDLRLREVLVADLGQRLTAPQRERLAEVRRRPARFAGRERATAVAGEALETAHVDVLRRGPQEVGTRPGEQHLAPGGRLQRLPEPGDVYVQ